MDSAVIGCLSGKVEQLIRKENARSAYLCITAELPGGRKDFRIRWACTEDIPPIEPGDPVLVAGGQLYMPTGDASYGINIEKENRLLVFPVLAEKTLADFAQISICGNVTDVTPVKENVEYIDITSEVPGGNWPVKIRRVKCEDSLDLHPGEKIFVINGRLYLSKDGSLRINADPKNGSLCFRFPVNDGDVNAEDVLRK